MSLLQPYSTAWACRPTTSLLRWLTGQADAAHYAAPDDARIQLDVAQLDERSTVNVCTVNCSTPSSVTLVTCTVCNDAINRDRRCSGARSPPHFLCSNCFSFWSNPASTRHGEHSSRCCCTFARFSTSISSSKNNQTSRSTSEHWESLSIGSIGSPQAIAATSLSLVPDVVVIVRTATANSQRHRFRTHCRAIGRRRIHHVPLGPQESAFSCIGGQQFTQLTPAPMQPRHHGPQRGTH